MKKNIKVVFASLAMLTLGLSACSNVSPSIFQKTDPNAIYVSSVTLDIEYISMDISETFDISATVTMMEGYEEVEYQSFWKSSRPNVVKVESSEKGKATVTTLSAGTASISYIAGYKMASCTIVVNGGNSDPTHEEEQPEEVGVTLSAASKTISVGDTFLLIATTNDGSSVSWSTANEQKDDPESTLHVASVDENGLVTAISAGTIDVVATSGEKSAKCKITVNDPSIVPVDPEDPEEEDDEKSCTVYFFIDYNNIDEKDETGKKLLKKFRWYGNVPLSQSGLVPANPTSEDAPDPAFPNFIGWSSHTIIDSVNDLWNLESDLIGNEYFFYLYGIWSDVTPGGFVK